MNNHVERVATFAKASAFAKATADETADETVAEEVEVGRVEPCRTCRMEA